MTRARALPASVVVAACCVAGLAAPAGGPAQAAAPPRALVATAVHPGTLASETVSLGLRSFLYGHNVRFLRSPSPGTVVVAVPDVEEVTRRGRWMVRKAKPCGQARLTLSLHFDQPDPLRLAADLAPVASTVSYSAETLTVQGLGVGVPPIVSVVRSDDRPMTAPGMSRTATGVLDWRRAGRYGFSALTATTTMLRATGRCAPEKFDWSPGDLAGEDARSAGGA